jgi:hypothetical protein
MVIDTPFLRCFFCGRRFPADMEALEGRFIPSWRVAVCDPCVTGNREGLPASHPAIKLLTQRGVRLDISPAKKVAWPETKDGRAPNPSAAATGP